MKSRNKRWVNTAILLLILVGIIGAIAGSIIVRKHKVIKIIYVSKSNDYSDFWSVLINGAEMAAEETGAEIKVVAPSTEQDVKTQNELIENAIAEKPDAILLSPSDFNKSLPAAKKIKEHGIKIILIDSLLSEHVEDTAVATDNVKAAELVGEYVKELCTPDSKIGIVNHVKGSSTGIDREKGIRKGLGEEESRIVETVFSDSDYDKGYKVTKKMLLEHPDMDLIVTTNEYSTTGAGRVVKDMGLQDQIKIVGFDNSIEEIQMLESGILEAIVIQKPFEMGYLGVKSAVQLVRNGTGEREIDSGCKLITKDSIYTEENQKLLFPFIERSGK